MLDHISLRVSDLERSRRFFGKALSPLGPAGKPELWIKGPPPGASVHVAFASPDSATVDAFYEAAIEAVCHLPQT